MKLLKLISERMPDSKNILAVYAFIVTLVYSWTLFTSFYKLPSWLFYLSIGKILSVYAYAFSFDLLESLIALTVILLLDFTVFLFLKNKEEFQSRSMILAGILLGTSMLRLALFQNYEDITAFLSGELLWWAVAIPLGLVLAVFAPRIKLVRTIFEGFAERATVFVYIYIPLSLIALVVVLIRNIN
jgi:hypothetical protein